MEDSRVDWEVLAALERMRFLSGSARELMLAGERYYKGRNDILFSGRTQIGEGGARVTGVADNRLAHGFLRELADQKVQYLLGRPYSLSGDEEFVGRCKDYLGEEFAQTLRQLALDAVVKGLGWAQVYYRQGRLAIGALRPEEVCPIYIEGRLEGVLRLYKREELKGRKQVTVQRGELYTLQGVRLYEVRGDRLVETGRRAHVYLKREGEWLPFNWERLPFVPLCYNKDKLPLLGVIKSLIDDYDKVASGDSNALQEQPDSIYVLKNYDGQSLSEFRKKLARYRAVKVSDDGGVTAINTPVNTQAANEHLERLRRDIYAFGRGVDTRPDRSFGLSGVALRHEYAALDLDAGGLENQAAQAVEKLLWFVRRDIVNRGGQGQGQLRLVFNRDVLINEEAAVELCVKSAPFLSARTLLENHPWVTDVEKEMLEKEGEVKNGRA